MEILTEKTTGQATTKSTMRIKVTIPNVGKSSFNY